MLASIVVAAALAAPPELVETVPARSFQLDLGAQAYFTRLVGNFNDGAAQVSVEDIGLHDSVIAIDAAMTVHEGKLHASLQALSFNTSGSGIAAETMSFSGITVGDGDAFTSSLDLWTFGAKVAYDFWEPYADDTGSAQHATPNNFEFVIQGVLALEFVNMSRTISDTTALASMEGDDSFLVPSVGGGFDVSFDVEHAVGFVERVEIYTDALIGATLPLQSDGGFGMALNIDAGCRLWLTPHFAMNFGYQLVGGAYDGRDIDLTGSLQGIVVGASWRF